jgi:hypothetical protein
MKVQANRRREYEVPPPSTNLHGLIPPTYAIPIGSKDDAIISIISIQSKGMKYVEERAFVECVNTATSGNRAAFPKFFCLRPRSLRLADTADVFSKDTSMNLVLLRQPSKLPICLQVSLPN